MYWNWPSTAAANAGTMSSVNVEAVSVKIGVIKIPATARDHCADDPVDGRDAVWLNPADERPFLGFGHGAGEQAEPGEPVHGREHEGDCDDRAGKPEALVGDQALADMNRILGRQDAGVGIG